MEGFKKPFPNFLKLELLVNSRPADDMAPENSLPITAHLPSGLSAVEREIARACKQARRDSASARLIAVSKTIDAGAFTPAIEAGLRPVGAKLRHRAQSKLHSRMSGFPRP